MEIETEHRIKKGMFFKKKSNHLLLIRVRLGVKIQIKEWRYGCLDAVIQQGVAGVMGGQLY